MAHIPRYPPCPSPLTTDAARWHQYGLGGLWRPDPCRNGGGTSGYRARLQIRVSAPTYFYPLIDVTCSIGSCKFFSNASCSASGYVSVGLVHGLVDLWGAIDAAAWSSSLSITVRATTPSAAHIMTPVVSVYSNGKNTGDLSGTAQATSTPRAVACATSLVGCNTWTVTAYDDGSFSIT